MKLVSFSVYGSDKKYHRGAIANAQLMKSIYPDWTMRLYCEVGLPVKRLEKLGVDVRLMRKSRGHTGMLWRFLPAGELGVERVIFRDTDSRINVREAAAVEDWIESGQVAHAMHDHDHHRSWKLFGGMWGIKGNSLPLEILTRLKRTIQNKRLERVDDMVFLRDLVLPEIKNRTLHHSSVKLRWPSSEFPDHEPFDGFVGQQIG